MPCTLEQIDNAVKDIKKAGKDVLHAYPKVVPILY
jgi:hypothetical protein